jgi:hypothetical protein
MSDGWGETPGVVTQRELLPRIVAPIAALGHGLIGVNRCAART